jgi:hypothetical protein
MNRSRRLLASLRSEWSGLDRGDEVLVPDQPALAAYALTQADRAAYDVVMRVQAAKPDRGM